MKNRKILLIVALLFFATSPLFANKSSVTLESRQMDANTVEVTVNVSHAGNNYFHHTDWVKIFVNGNEVNSWNYSKNNLPPSENFKLIYLVKITGETLIECQADCNIHGSAGKISISIGKK